MQRVAQAVPLGEAIPQSLPQAGSTARDTYPPDSIHHRQRAQTVAPE